MSAPINQNDFPQYFFDGNCLYAFVAKDKMYKIEPRGSNMNPGVTIDHYITRNMVLKHWGKGHRLEKTKFKEMLDKLFAAYINKIAG